jgi:hypothetical protein
MCGNREMLVMIEASQDEVVVNDDQADVDFRCETDNNSHTLFVEGGTDRVGILNSSPTVELDVTGAILASSTITGSNLSGTNTGDEAAADTSIAGIIEVATPTEVNAGTSDSLCLTPDNFNHSNAGLWMFDYLIDAPVVGNGATFFETPTYMAGMNIVAIDAFWSGTIGTGAATSVQLYNLTQTADVLSTNLTIDDGERSSSTAATPAVIDTDEDDITSGDIYQIDVDAIGSTVAGTNLVIRVWARKA